VLQQLGISREEAESALRFSFSSLNTPQEAEICLAALEELTAQLRRFTRR
jgi:cysteine sulfinate desulfinase/cysteine desulfurase-like protein